VTFNSYDPSFGASWELDVWGRLRDTRNAAGGEFRAATYDYESARLSLAAQVTKSWFAIVETSAQLELSRNRLRTFESNERLIQTQFERGLTSALDYRLSRSQTRTARATVTQQEATLESQIRQFEVVLGRYPAKELETQSELPEIQTPIPSGLPSELLERRPDLLAAEERFYAAAERLNASVKLRLPQFALTGNLGTSSNELDDVLDTDFRVWGVVGNITQPIFQGGAIEGGIERSEALLDQAGESYRRSALTAFQEVETALANTRFIAQQKLNLEEVVEETVAAEALAWDRYQRGLVDVVTVLEAQRRAFDAQANFLSILNLELQNRIDLYLALGGPFEEEATPVEIAALPTP
jgi:NodT family efflux transporter outer membrane factor (OMF) lipoprotein